MITAIKSLVDLQNQRNQSLRNLRRIIKNENETVKNVETATRQFQKIRFDVDYSKLIASMQSYQDSIVTNDKDAGEILSCFLYGGESPIPFALPKEVTPFVRCQWVECFIGTLFGVDENPNSDESHHIKNIENPDGDVEYDEIFDDWNGTSHEIDLDFSLDKDKFPVDSIDDFVNQNWDFIDWELIDRRTGDCFSASGATVHVLVAYFGIK